MLTCYVYQYIHISNSNLIDKIPMIINVTVSIFMVNAYRM